ncbi:hypothetical protein ACJX0J_016163 [Zea mays]
MSRGCSASGGQSSLGYLFGSGEPPKPVVAPAASAPPVEKPSAAKTDATKQVAAGVTSQTNNYHRADGQNTGNFLTLSTTSLRSSLITSIAVIISLSLTSDNVNPVNTEIFFYSTSLTINVERDENISTFLSLDISPIMPFSFT